MLWRRRHHRRFRADWANPETTRELGDMVARYVVREINGYLDGLRQIAENS